MWKVPFEEKVSSQKRYRMEIWAKKLSGSSGGSVSVDLKFHNAAHAQSETKNKTILLSSLTTSWQKFTLEFTPLTTTDHLYEASIDFTANSFGTVWYDRFNFYELNITKTFADGLGRDIQTLQREGNAAIKSATIYDFAHRVNKVTKPFASTDTTFVLDPVTAANNYYNGLYPYYPGWSSDTSPYAYYETEYETNPLDRIKNQYFPGTTYSRAGTHFVKYQYGTNVAGELGITNAGAVLETRIFDENGVETEIFMDTFGNKVGVRVDSSNTQPG